MPKIYKKNCNVCGNYYEGDGAKFCSKKCYYESGLMKKFKDGHHPKTEFVKGHLVSEKVKNAVSQAHKNKMPWNKGLKGFLAGINSPHWKGGISFEPYSIDWTETLRRAIMERDHYVCRICLEYGHIVHHIDYDKKNCNLNNLITLCKKCHPKTNFNREFWKKYFQNLVF